MFMVDEGLPSRGLPAYRQESLGIVVLTLGLDLADERSARASDGSHQFAAWTQDLTDKNA